MVAQSKAYLRRRARVESSAYEHENSLPCAPCMIPHSSGLLVDFHHKGVQKTLSSTFPFLPIENLNLCSAARGLKVRPNMW